jgi:hypothetical protein
MKSTVPVGVPSPGAAGCKARLQTQGHVAALGSALEVAQRTVGLAQVGVVNGIPQVQGDGPPDVLGSLTVIPLLMQIDAQQVQGVGVVGLGAEDAAVPPDGLGQQSALVLLQANGKLVVHGDALSILKGARRAPLTPRARAGDNVGTAATWGPPACSRH